MKNEYTRSSKANHLVNKFARSCHHLKVILFTNLKPGKHYVPEVLPFLLITTTMSKMITSIRQHTTAGMTVTMILLVGDDI